MRTKRYILLSCMLCSATLFAQIIPESRRVDWSAAGIDMPFLAPEYAVSVIDYGAVGDNSSNNTPAFQAAINAANAAGGGLVNIPAGTYLLQGGLNLPSGLTLRGADATLTQLRFALPNSGTTCINASGAAAGPYRAVTSGYTQGSSMLSVADTTGLRPGHFAELVQDNNSTWDTEPISWANDSKGQIVRITAVSGNTIWLRYPLRTNYDATHNVRIRPIAPVKNISVECLHIERTSDATGSGGGNNIAFTYAVNCRISGVRSNKSVGAHFFLFQSSDIEVKGCYLHDAFTYDGTSTRGYGVVIGAHAGQCLIVNNIFRHLRHAMMVKQGANGNVFAYNYSADGYRSEFPNEFASDISLHGHYAYANLFEGNHSELFWADDAWGPSGPYNTMFRNRFTRHGIYMTSAGTNSQNFVGNEVTSNAFLQGFYTLTGSDHLAHGNNIRGTINPSGTGTLADISYFFEATPDFWNISAPFPPIGIPNAINSQTIPAKARYDQSNYTLCASTAPPLRLQLSAMLQGAYIGNDTMTQALRSQQLLPVAQPFGAAPFNYKGSEMLYDLQDLPTNTTDWVLVELRNAANANQVIARRAALLLHDGMIVDIDGNTNGIAFADLPAATYYIALRTRNHLPVLSATPISLPNATPLDLSDPANVLGDTTQLVQYPTETRYLIPVGDANANALMTYTDLHSLVQLPATQPTYHPADCNMDGYINATDHEWLINNLGRIGLAELR